MWSSVQCLFSSSGLESYSFDLKSSPLLGLDWSHLLTMTRVESIHLPVRTRVESPNSDSSRAQVMATLQYRSIIDYRLIKDYFLWHRHIVGVAEYNQFMAMSSCVTVFDLNLCCFTVRQDMFGHYQVLRRIEPKQLRSTQSYIYYTDDKKGEGATGSVFGGREKVQLHTNYTLG